jgi:hypothetical protein
MSRAFNGTTDWIMLNPSASLDSIGPTLTMMAWVYLTDISVPRWVWDLREGQPSLYPFRLSVAETGSGFDQALIGTVPYDLGVAQSQSALNSIPLNTWKHVAMTFDDGGDRFVHLFIDGVEVVTYLQHLAGIGTETLTPGFPAFISIQQWAGDIAEARLWNVKLTPAEVASAMTGGNPQAANEVAYLHLCGLLSPEPDSSGNGNVGVLTGTTAGPDSPGFSCSGPVVASIVPPTGVHCTTFNVAVNGTGFDPAGTSTLSFSGTGIKVNYYLPGSSTQVNANITVSCDAALVARDVVVTNSDQTFATLAAAFTPLQLPVQWWSMKNLQLYMSPDPTLTIRGNN